MKRYTRGEAIRAKCLECSCGSSHEVRLCPVADCALYRYRLGYEEREADELSRNCGEIQNGQDATEFSAQNESKEESTIVIAAN